MARVTDGLVSWADIVVMSFDGIITARGTLSRTDFKLITKDELLAETFQDSVAVQNRLGNQYVAFQDVKDGILIAGTSNPRNVPNTAGNFVFQLKAPNGFTTSENASWLLVTPNTGTGDSIDITVSYDANTVTVDRNVIITFTDDVTLQTVQLEVIQAAAPVTYDPVSLGYSTTSSADACSDFVLSPVTRYILSNETFPLISELWNDSNATVPAPAGWYSDGTLWIEWDGSARIDNGSC